MQETIPLIPWCRSLYNTVLDFYKSTIEHLVCTHKKTRQINKNAILCTSVKRRDRKMRHSTTSGWPLKSRLAHNPQPNSSPHQLLARVPSTLLTGRSHTVCLISAAPTSLPSLLSLQATRHLTSIPLLLFMLCQCYFCCHRCLLFSVWWRAAGCLLLLSAL